MTDERTLGIHPMSTLVEVVDQMLKEMKNDQANTSLVSIKFVGHPDYPNLGLDIYLRKEPSDWS